MSKRGAPVIEELNEARDDEDDEEAWDRTAALFIKRAGAHEWRLDEEVEDFVGALMRATGCKLVQIRHHGWVWKTP
jgi:hypothetical protein